MKATDDIYNTEGQSKPTSYHAWTGDDSSSFNQLKDMSSRPVDEAEHGISDVIAKDHPHHHSWYGKWGSHHSEGSSQSNWESKLEALKNKAAARRKEEDEQYFSGVYKAFGKSAGQRMMAAFEGKKVKGLHKIKIDEKALAARKHAIARNVVLPHKKHAGTAARAHKAVVEKHAAHAAAAASSTAKADQGVKAALGVATKMDKHAAPEPAAAAAKPAAAATKPEAKKKGVLKHPGVVADARKIKELVHEFRHAHGKKKRALKARVMQLKEDIVNDFAKVTAFGKRATTAFQRAEAKEAAKKKGAGGGGDGASSHKSHHFVWH
jgi:hypothetical protein